MFGGNFQQPVWFPGFGLWAACPQDSPLTADAAFTFAKGWGMNYLPSMKRLTAIIYPGESKRWLVAFNPETGTTSQGRTVEQALANLKAATELYLEESKLVQRAPAFLTTFEVAHA